MSVPVDVNMREKKLTKSSPHISIAPVIYFALASILHIRWTPSTPAVSFRQSPRPSPVPNAAGTARIDVNESVSKASSDEYDRTQVMAVARR